ncbi:MAG: hypothetical protein JJU48_10650 [Methylophaga sp.]|nr:hypothetical protein [Methylophaga sp.]
MNKSKNRPLYWIQAFLDANLLFKNGETHRSEKKVVQRLTNDLEAHLLEWQPRLNTYFYKRRSHILSAIDFAQKITRITLGLLISHALSIPLRRALKCLDRRQNIWFIYFHPSRQAAMDAALKYLYQGNTPPDQNDPHYFSHLLVQSLIVMGYDPLVASICASICEADSTDFASDSYRYCPTSFVSRICKQAVLIDGNNFDAGDVCFTSLVPAADQPENNRYTQNSSASSLAYGVGAHVCVGKSLSLTILGMAQQIFEQHFSDGFAHRSVIASDGAFLSFEITS